MVEDNLFYDGFSSQIDLDADPTVWVQQNVFQNTWHAVAILGRNIRVTENHISVPGPQNVPLGFAGVALDPPPLVMLCVPL